MSKNANTITKAQAEESQKLADKRAQMVLAIGGFGAFGLLVGFLWGANHMVAQVAMANPISQATVVGALITTNTADWMQGLIMGTIGTAVGAGFGFSLFLSRRS